MITKNEKLLETWDELRKRIEKDKPSFVIRLDTQITHSNGGDTNTLTVSIELKFTA